ncbi:MAG: hypothetical protein J6T28_01000 [Paludibacteraceae bacterium]|nr:hypothetical protein [Paludibacteraceae bacterium]
MKTELNGIKSASDWQGTDKYAGIDSYEKITLKAGSELCALVSYEKNGQMRPCEYLFSKKELELANGDDRELNRMLQIAPYKEMKTQICSYRNEIAIFKLKRDLEVETGKTRDNPAYGAGGMTQYYIPGRVFSDLIADKENGMERVSFEDGTNVKFLGNNVIDAKEYDLIQNRHAQLQMRRNLFCTRRAKIDTLDIIQNSQRPEDIELAKKNLKKLNANIQVICQDITESKKRFGKVPSPLYDSLNRQLAEEIKLREGKENVLVLGNAKVEQSIKHVSEVVLDKASLNVVTLEEDRAQAVAQNLFKKIDEYDPKKDWNDIDVKNQGLVDVMNINRINRECQKVMAEEALRPRDFQALERIALPTSDGKSKEYRLDELFDEKSVQKIRSSQNGHLTEPLQMKGGQTAKLMMLGNKAHLFLAQPKEKLNNVLDKMSLDDTERKRLLNGETIAYKQSHVKLDKDLNCVVWGTVGRLSPPAKTQAHTHTEKLAVPKRKNQGKKCGHSL